MSRQITRREVNWERASCLGLETDLFYMMRTDLALEGLTYNHLRRMCFDCPIQRECLQIATAHERYGFWGGLAEEERITIHDNKQGLTLMRLKRDLVAMGVPFQPLADIVLSVERFFGDDYTERRINERNAKSGSADTAVDGNLL